MKPPPPPQRADSTRLPQSRGCVGSSVVPYIRGQPRVTLLINAPLRRLRTSSMEQEHAAGPGSAGLTVGQLLVCNSINYTFNRNNRHWSSTCHVKVGSTWMPAWTFHGTESSSTDSRLLFPRTCWNDNFFAQKLHHQITAQIDRNKNLLREMNRIKWEIRENYVKKRCTLHASRSSVKSILC